MIDCALQCAGLSAVTLGAQSTKGRGYWIYHVLQMLRVDALLDSVLKTVNPDVVSKITVKPDGNWEASAVCFPDIQPSVHALPLTTPIRHRCP